MVITSLDGTVRPVNLDSVGGLNFQVGGGWSQDPVAYPETVRPGNDPTQGIAAASLHFFLADHLGTTQMELSAQGYPVWRGQFAPYGGEMKNSVLIPPDAIDGSINPYKFTGKERDAESGLDYFGARYYASSMGRWMSPDWADKPEAVPYSSLANPQSLNLYGYVLNNPLSKTDADWHAPDILVIEDGPTQGNPIGHTAIAVTGRGVYSFGTNTPLGSSTTDFLQIKSGRRNQTMTVIKTTPEQDQAAVTELTKQNANGSINLYPDSCASRTNAARDAAGVPQKTYSTPVAEVPAQDTSMPGTAGSRAQATPGSQTTVIPKNGAVPSNLNQFNPKLNQPPPPVEKKTPNTAGSSS